MIWVRKTQDEDGMYIDGSEVRWTVDWCNKIYCPCSLTEEEHGYERFNSVEAAIEHWGLKEYEYPEEETKGEIE